MTFTAFLLQTVCDGGGGGFAGDMKDLETHNSAGILDGLTLAVSFIFTRTKVLISSGAYHKNNLRTTGNRPRR